MRFFNSIFIVFTLGSFLSVSAQECESYFPLKKGVTFELAHYDAKDKLTTTVSYEVVESGMKDGAAYAKVHDVITPVKGEVTTSDFEAYCKKDVIFIDARALLPGDILEPYQNMNITLTGEEVQIPSRMSEGMSLPDASVLITIDAGIPLKMSVTITDRKVIAKESVTTPAGTFSCWKITEQDQVKVGVSINYTTTQWICPGVGLVKQESFRPNGKKMSSSILEKFSKP